MKSIELVHQFYKFFGEGNLEGAFSLLDSNITWELVGPKSIPYFGTYTGRDGVSHFFKLLFEVEQVVEFMPEEFIEGGQTICVLGREKCIAKTTGRTFETKWVHIFTCKGDKIQRWREYIDTAPMVAAYE